MPPPSSPPRWLWACVLATLLLAWALHLYRLDFQDIWWDEARNIDVATRPLSQIASAPELDIHPPAYFYALHAWTTAAGRSAFATRFFSAWFGLLAAALVYRLGRGLARGEFGWLAGALALVVGAVAPFGLAEAQETRMYTFAWAILAAGALALGMGVAGGRGAGVRAFVRTWGPFAALAALALLTHYATAMILATWALWALIWALASPQRWPRLRTLTGAAVGVLLLFLPALPIALRQIPGYSNPNLTLPNLQSYLGQLYQAFTLGEFVPGSVWQLGRWLWLLLPVGGALLAWREGVRPRLSFLGVWLVGGLAVFYGVLVLRSAFDPRYISFVLPALWALAGWALAGWRRLGRGLPWLTAAVLVGISLPSLRADLTDPAGFREDMRGVTAYLQANATGDDIILVDQRYPFGFYWQRWNNDFYGFPPAEPRDQAPAQYLFVDINHIDERLTALAGRAQSVFWVTWFESDMDPRGAVTALLNAYASPAAAAAHFRGYSIQRWDVQPPVTFKLASAYVDLGSHFESGVTLLAGDWTGRQTPVAPGQGLLTLRWQVDAPTARPLKVSLRLKDASGATLAQDDRLLLNDRHLRTPAWTAGESALNVYSLPLPTQPGVYTLTLVLYDEETLEAVGLSDGSGIEPTLGMLTVGG